MQRRAEILSTAQALLSGAAAHLFVVTSPMGNKTGINISGLLTVSTDIVNGLDAHMVKDAEKEQNPPPAAGGSPSSLNLL